MDRQLEMLCEAQTIRRGTTGTRTPRRCVSGNGHALSVLFDLLWGKGLFQNDKLVCVCVCVCVGLDGSHVCNGKKSAFVQSLDSI
jgi:hypothetical protein